MIALRVIVAEPFQVPLIVLAEHCLAACSIALSLLLFGELILQRLMANSVNCMIFFGSWIAVTVLLNFAIFAFDCFEFVVLFLL